MIPFDSDPIGHFMDVGGLIMADIIVSALLLAPVAIAIVLIFMGLRGYWKQWRKK